MSYDDLFKNTQCAHIFMPCIFEYVLEKHKGNAFGVFCQIVEVHFEKRYFLRDKVFKVKDFIPKVSAESIPNVLDYIVNPNSFYHPVIDRRGVFIEISDKEFLEKENLYHRGVKDGFVWFSKQAFT